MAQASNLIDQLEAIQNTKQIGRMLINHLGLYSGQSRISKNGIVGAYGLPIELVCYIAAFINR